MVKDDSIIDDTGIPVSPSSNTRPCKWRIDELSLQLKIKFPSHVSKKIVSGDSMWISKIKAAGPEPPKPPPPPSDKERLVMGEWLWSNDNETQIAHFWLKFDNTAKLPSTGKNCYFTDNSNGETLDDPSEGLNMNADYKVTKCHWRLDELSS